jgi:hypothetical protein
MDIMVTDLTMEVGVVGVDMEAGDVGVVGVVMVVIGKKYLKLFLLGNNKNHYDA